MINAMELSNVKLEKNQNKVGVEMHKHLNEFVVTLATTNPMWEFVGEKDYHDKVWQVQVKLDGETIGVARQEHSSRSGGPAIRVMSDNLPSGRMRSSDIKKAVREAKKAFMPKSLKQLMDDSVDSIKNTVLMQIRFKERDAREHQVKIHDSVYRFAFERKRDELLAYLTQSEVTHLEKFESARTEGDEINKIRDASNKAYVHMHKGKYIVKVLDNVQSYDDNTLPEEYKAKIGMLKLIEDEQCISNVGCRHDKDNFLVVI